MVYEVVCGVCGKVLYSGMEVRSPREVLKAPKYDGKCSACGTSLSTSDFRLDVMPASNL